MSNENAPRIFKHTDDRHVQTRIDYMLIYRSESKAKLVRVLETWMDTKYAESFKGAADSKDQKTTPPEEDLWITMSYDQFSLYVYGTIKHDTIKQQVDELVASKHVERRVHPVYPYGPPQYRLNRELVQKSLDELVIPANLYDLIGDFVSPKKKHTPPERYPQGGGKKPTRDPGKIPPGTGESSHPSNNLSENTNNHANNEGTYCAGESAHAALVRADAPTRISHPEHDFIWFDDLVCPSVMWVRYTQAFPGPMFSEYEDKRRSRKAGEVRSYLESCGINVKLVNEHETGEERTLEATTYRPEKPSGQDSYSPAHAQAPQNENHSHGGEIHGQQQQTDPDRDRIRDAPLPGLSPLGERRVTEGKIHDPDRHHPGMVDHHQPARQRPVAFPAVQAEPVDGGRRHDPVASHGQDGGPEAVGGEQPGRTPVAPTSQGEHAQKGASGARGYMQTAEENAESGKQGSKRSRRTAQPAEEIVLSPKARKIFDAWCSLFHVSVKLTPANAKASEDLVEPVTVWGGELHMTVAELLKDIKNWLFATDRNGFYKRGVKLYDVSREFEGWQSAKEREMGTPAQNAPSKTPETVLGVARPARGNENHCLYPIEEMREQSNILWAEMQAQLASPEIQAKLAAKGITL